MGNWTIVIHGTGAHHNESPFDADVITGIFVRALKDAGHTVNPEDVSFTASSRQNGYQLAATIALVQAKMPGES